MNDKSNDFLNRLIAAFRRTGGQVEAYQMSPDGKIEKISPPNPTRMIHERVDIDLVNALGQWLESQEITEAVALSSLAFALASHLHQTTLSENEGCEISADFERYIHESVHLLHQKYGPMKKDTDVGK